MRTNCETNVAIRIQAVNNKERVPWAASLNAAVQLGVVV